MKPVMKPVMKNITFTIMLFLASHGVSAVEQIAVQALFGNKAMLMIDGERHTLCVGQISPQGVNLISANTTAAVLEIAAVQTSSQPGSAVSLSFTKREAVAETVYANRRGMFESVGTINGQTVDFLLDTGATLIAMNTRQAKRLGIDYRMVGKPAGASTASGYVKGYKVKLRSVTLGDIKRSNVDAMVIDGTHPGPILLGMSFLGDLKVEKIGNALTVRQRR